MKKTICIICIVAIVLAFVSVSTAFSADTDFVIEDSILISYNGNDESVSVPNSVKAIADNAFLNNTTIKSIKLHSDVYSIGNKAFFGCASLESVSNAESVSYVGALCFAGTPFLTQSTEEFLTVGGALVSYNGESADVTLPENVVSVSPYAFLQNDVITSFEAGANLSSIGEGAFYDCSKLSQVNVTDSVTYIGADAFYGTKWQNSQGDFAVLGNDILVRYNGVDSVVIIPSGILQIAPNAFYENKSITSVIVPSSVFAIGDRAFMGCDKLNEIELNLGLVSIGKEAFADCESLASLTTPMSLSRISQGAFINCNRLNVCFLRGNNLIIERGAFANCSNLESALLSSTVLAVMDDAFYNDAKLISISVPKNIAMITPNAFSGKCNPVVICEEKSFAHTALSNDFYVSLIQGDSDTDHKLSVLDATTIQLHIAGLDELPVSNFAFMDADCDATVSVLDATYIQLSIAQLL